MHNGYAMLVVDLDGTLLRSDGSVSDANRRALDEARHAGMEVVLATGRSARESVRIVRQIDFEGVMITAGGSILCDARSGATIRRSALHHDVTEKVVDCLLAHDLKALVLKDAHVTGYDYLAVGDAGLHPASQWWFEEMDVRVRDHAAPTQPHPHPEDSLRVGAVASECDLAPIARKLLDDLAGCCRVQHWSAVTATEATGSQVHLLEVFGPQVDKWMMIELYCRERSIGPESVVAIGDGLNDVEMIEAAGLGIAMANADPRVLKVADRVADHHNRDGVASAVRAVLDGGGT